jgi:DNA-binding GntR family transcriptional regulator
MVKVKTVRQGAVLEKLSNDTLRNRVAQHIRKAILSGAYQPGERLVERQLAAQIGTSLTAVREAMIELELEGFITKKPNSTTHVTKLSSSDVKKIFAVRKVLETYAIEEACRHASAEQIEELEKICREMTNAAQEHSLRLFNECDFSYHIMLWECTDNEFLEAALRRLVLPLFAFEAIKMNSLDPFNLFRDVYTHLAIADAIKKRDVEAARRVFIAAIDEWFSRTQIELDGSSTGNRE